jgi:hypothetical protein
VHGIKVKKQSTAVCDKRFVKRACYERKRENSGSYLIIYILCCQKFVIKHTWFFHGFGRGLKVPFVEACSARPYCVLASLCSSSVSPVALRGSSNGGLPTSKEEKNDIACAFSF